MKYRKKPVIIEAIQFKDTADRICEISEFVGRDIRVNYEDKNNPYILIETLEGVMKASVDDYIVKGVHGEFYPCKPDIFDKTYDRADNSNAMDFGDAIEVLKQGGAIRRKGWNGKEMFVVKQIPAHITEDIIPKMQSLPQSAKDLIMARENKFIDYTNQMLIINQDGRADSWVPSSSDVFAEDWEVVL